MDGKLTLLTGLLLLITFVNINTTTQAFFMEDLFFRLSIIVSNR